MVDFPFGEVSQKVFHPVVKGKQIPAGNLEGTLYLLNAKLGIRVDSHFICSQLPGLFQP
jgi:hypothetical protein